ncbi:hypothetical protein RDABS01_000018, partial [Bienertia sinuspersici]
MNQSKYQMNFIERMTLIPLTSQSSLCTSPYLSINEIPRSDDAKEELVDVLGIVLFVGETRLVPINGSDVPVRDIITTDDRNGAVHSWWLDSQLCASKHRKGATNVAKKVDAKKGALYKCAHCNNTQSVSVPRITFKFKAVDATSTQKFTTFTREIETLFDMTSDQIHEMRYSENAPMLKEKIEQFYTTEIYLQVGPTNTLTTSQMLSW